MTEFITIIQEHWLHKNSKFYVTLPPQNPIWSVLWGKYDYHSHSMIEETETRKSWITNVNASRWWLVGLEFKHKLCLIVEL